MGLVAFVAAGVERPEIAWPQITITVVGGAVSFLAGVILWQNRPFARPLSLFVQGLQVPHISISGIVQYGISLGAAIIPSIGFAPQSFRHPIYSLLRVGNQANGFYVGVNVLALAALILVAMSRHANSAKSDQIIATA